MLKFYISRHTFFAKERLCNAVIQKQYGYKHFFKLCFICCLDALLHTTKNPTPFFEEQWLVFHCLVTPWRTFFSQCFELLKNCYFSISLGIMMTFIMSTNHSSSSITYLTENQIVLFHWTIFLDPSEQKWKLFLV